LQFLRNFREHNAFEQAELILGVALDPGNWLQVLGTAERSQVDQGIRHHLHPIVSLLNAFKAEQQPLELVLVWSKNSYGLKT
jgi:hypothetical protein